jgi:hypothetical protein
MKNIMNERMSIHICEDHLRTHEVPKIAKGRPIWRQQGESPNGENQQVKVEIAAFS